MQINFYRMRYATRVKPGIHDTVIQVARLCAGMLLLCTFVACATEQNSAQSKPGVMPSESGASSDSKGKADSVTDKQMKFDNPEPISGFKFNGNTIVAEVISHGCTRNDDFEIEYVVSNNQCNVLVTRVKPDLCRRAPMLQTIEVEWQAPADCQSLPIILSNPVLVAPESGLLSKRLNKEI